MRADATTIARARLRPAESQRVFRVLVAALANPGRLHHLPPEVLGRTPTPVIPLLALSDIEVTIAVQPDPDDWAGALTVATGAPASAVADAEWVAFLEPPTTAELGELDPGSAYVPERGTRIAVPVTSLGAVDGGRVPSPDVTVIRLRGPGVPGHVDVAVGGVAGALFEALAAINSDFPAGVDTWLLTPDGTVAAIPRSSSIEVR